jgi:hypothetical protein
MAKQTKPEGQIKRLLDGEPTERKKPLWTKSLKNKSENITPVRCSVTFVFIFAIITQVNAAISIRDSSGFHNKHTANISYDTLGNGAVKIMIHLFASGEKVTLTPELTTDTLSETYLIKDKKVLHVNQFTIKSGKLVSTVKSPLKDSVVSADSIASHLQINTTIHAEWVQFNYLIDWEKQQVYVFDAPMPKDTIYKLKLSEMSLDFVYNLLSQGQTVASLHLNEDRSVEIAGHTCYSGTAVMKNTGDKVDFYYTQDALGFISPLNAFIPSSSPINVMAVYYTAKGFPTSTESTMLFKIDGIINQKYDDKLFALPPKATIVKISSVNQITQILSDYHVRTLHK